MGKFIEEFYYGNLDPQARSTKENKDVQKQMEVLMLNEDFLTDLRMMKLRIWRLRIKCRQKIEDSK